MKTSFILLFVAISWPSCSQQENTPSLTEDDRNVITYFKEIALGLEFSNDTEVTRRWNSPMKIFVGGNPTPELQAELSRIVVELNELATTDFEISTVADSADCNYHIFFGSHTAYSKMFPGETSLANDNFGLFYVFWNGRQELYRGHMYVDLYRPTETEQKHLLREELTQSLGLMRDSYRYPESIFQQSYQTKTTEYAEIDRQLIRLLYHPKMKARLNATEAEKILTDILLNDK